MQSEFLGYTMVPRQYIFLDEEGCKEMVSAPSLVAEMTDSIQDKSNCSNDNCGMKLVLGV